MKKLMSYVPLAVLLVGALWAGARNGDARAPEAERRIELRIPEPAPSWDYLEVWATEPEALQRQLLRIEPDPSRPGERRVELRIPVGVTELQVFSDGCQHWRLDCGAGVPRRATVTW